MTEFLNDWGLILTIFLPLAGAVVMMAIPKESEGSIKAVALGTSVLAAVVGVLLLGLSGSAVIDDSPEPLIRILTRSSLGSPAPPPGSMFGVNW